MQIKVAITDDHPLAIQGIKAMLGFYSHIEVTDTYLSGTALMDGLEIRQPDVLLLDILLPDKSGLDLAPVIRKNYPQVRIVVLTSLDAPSMVKSMLQYGCLGYVLKGADQDTLVAAVEHAYRGEEFIEASLKEHLLQSMLKAGKQNTSGVPDLTKREHEILQLVVQEYTTQAIADKLFISARTAETHRLTIQKKLGVKNTAGLVLKALQWGLVEGFK